MPVEQIDDPSVKIKPPSKLIHFVRKSVNVKEAPEGLRALKKAHKPEVLLKTEDIKWLNDFLIEYRKDSKTKVYIHELLEGADIVLPEPKVTPRNPVLEARIQKLTAQQSAREYEAMTKGVDAVRKFFPEDTISYQKLPPNIPENLPPPTHEWESVNSCPSCHKTFKHRCNLNTHVRYECGVPPRYNCPYCAKQAKHLTNARSHVKRCHPERELKVIDVLMGKIVGPSTNHSGYFRR